MPRKLLMMSGRSLADVLDRLGRDCVTQFLRPALGANLLQHALIIAGGDDLLGPVHRRQHLIVGRQSGLDCLAKSLLPITAIGGRQFVDLRRHVDIGRVLVGDRLRQPSGAVCRQHPLILVAHAEPGLLAETGSDCRLCAGAGIIGVDLVTRGADDRRLPDIGGGVGP